MRELILTQFRVELKRHLLWILLWQLVLIADFVIGLGWGHAFYGRVGAIVRSSESELIVMATYLIMVLLPVMVGHSDSPSVADGFLRTRPMPMSVVWLGKAMVLIVWMIVPTVIESVLLSLAIGAGTGHLVNLVVERLMYLLPIATFFRVPGRPGVERTAAWDHDSRQSADWLRRLPCSTSRAVI